MGGLSDWHGTFASVAYPCDCTLLYVVGALQIANRDVKAVRAHTKAPTLFSPVSACPRCYLQ